MFAVEVKEMRDQARRHTQLGLPEANVAFYDGIVQINAAVLQMRDDVLTKMAAELVESIRRNALIDWHLREPVRPTMRTKVRRLLAKHDYSPDLDEMVVLASAELLADARTEGKQS